MTQEIDLEKYHQLALQKQKEHRKVLANLKKKPPKNLDKIAQEIHDEVFQEIDCTACANCCKTLGPDFKEADIMRIAKYFKMKKIYQINHLTIKNTLTCPAAYLFVEKLKDRL